MTEPFLGEIRLFAGDYAPAGWLLCDGRTLRVSEHSALFSILLNRFGGDGRTTFAIPNLNGRVPVHAGQGPGLSLRELGKSGGSQTVVLSEDQMPSHSHTPMASAEISVADPSSRTWGKSNAGIYKSGKPSVLMHKDALELVGSAEAHPNEQPYLTLQFIIATSGAFPIRS